MPKVPPAAGLDRLMPGCSDSHGWVALTQTAYETIQVFDEYGNTALHSLMRHRSGHRIAIDRSASA